MALHAQSQGGTSDVRCDVDIGLADDDQDDSPARVVLGFAGHPARLTLRDRLLADRVELFTGEPLPGATLCPVRDGQAAPESVLPCARSSRIRYLVVESGRAGIGQWHAHRRNVVADVQRVYGELPGRLLGVGVLTDSDGLRGQAEAWYGGPVIECRSAHRR